MDEKFISYLPNFGFTQINDKEKIICTLTLTNIINQNTRNKQFCFDVSVIKDELQNSLLGKLWWSNTYRFNFIWMPLLNKYESTL